MTSLDLLKSFKLSKIFDENQRVDHFNSTKPLLSSIPIDDSGEFCAVGCSEDEAIYVYDMIHGKLKKTHFSRKYGVSLLRFAHRSTNLLYTSTKVDNFIRYLSTHDNSYLRYFKGHKAAVKALEMSPLSDTFISGSSDSLRMWDLRSPNCQGLMNLATEAPSSIQVAIDPQGMVFGVGLDNRTIRMYDIRNYGQGPFSLFQLQLSPSSNASSRLSTRYNHALSEANYASVEWNSLQFSPDGKDILISCKDTGLVLIDSFDGYVKERFEGNTNDELLPLEGCFSPDGNWVLCGSSDGCINIWQNSTSASPNSQPRNQTPIFSLEGHAQPVHKVLFNHNYLVFASLSGRKLGFWIPGY